MIKKIFIVFITSIFSLVSYAAIAKTTVTWWMESRPETDPGFQQKLADVFNSSQNEIELVMSFKEGLNDILRTAMLSGEGPDIVESPGPSYVKEYQEAGLIASMQGYADQYGWEDKFLGWAYQAGVFNGEFYAAPKTFETMIMLYNKTLFEEKGWSVPTTLSEYEDIASKIKAAGMNVFAYGSTGWQPTHEHLAGMYLNSYAGPDNFYKTLIGEKKWTDKEFVEALELLKKHMLDGYWSGSLENYYATDWDGFSAQFVNREAAMLPIGTWGFEIMQGFSDKSDDWAVSPLPIISKNGGNPNYQLSIGGTMSINASSENPDAAAKVIDWILSDKSRVLEFSAKRGYAEWLIPLAYEASDFEAGADPKVRDYLIDFAKVTGAGDYGYTTWTFYPAGAGTHIWKDMESVWANDITVTEFLTEQQKLWEKARKNDELLPIAAR